MNAHASICVQMGWRGQKIMNKNDDSLTTPGLKRRIARWRSWWNKHELYPPSVDRWFRQRSLFFKGEREHTHAILGSFNLSQCIGQLSESLQQRHLIEANRHLQRGFVLAVC